MHKTLFNLLALSCLHSFAEKEPHFKSIIQHITVNDVGKGFRTDVICRGYTTSHATRFTISFTELESIEDLTVVFKNEKNKIVKLGKDNITQRAILTDNFYTGIKSLQFELPQTEYFEYHYIQNSTDLMLLTSLFFKPEKYVDTVTYDIRIPQNYSLLYRFFELDTTATFFFDSLKTDHEKRFYISCINHNKSNHLKYKSGMFTRNNIQVPSVQLIAVPAKYESNPETVLNNWYSKLIESLPALNDNTLGEVIKYVGSTTDQDSIGRKVFRFVQSKIKYIDIENGIQAFKPHDANDTYLNKEGDCKDMAFLLYQILKHYNYNARLALVATTDHYYDMDFPTIACANHIICVIKKGDKYIYLDATEDECEYGFPSMQIQGRHMFLLGDSAGTYHYIQPVPASENRCEFMIKLNLNQHELAGTYFYSFNHASAVLYRTFSNQLKKNDFNATMNSILGDLTPGVNYKSRSVTLTDSSFSVNGSLALPDSSTLNYSDKKYLRLSFAPYLDLLPRSLSKHERMSTLCTLNKNSEIFISFPDEVKLINARDIEISEGAFQFRLSIAKTGSKEIKVNLSLGYDDVVIKSEQAESYNKFIAQIKYELNKGIIYQ